MLEDWFMTDKYKPSNPEHQRIKSKIEVCRVCTQTDRHTHTHRHTTHITRTDAHITDTHIQIQTHTFTCILMLIHAFWFTANF